MEQKLKMCILKHISNTKNIGCQGYIDIDNFREFNLKYGYAMGDEKLNRFELLVKDIVTPNYFIRIGSDEFYFSFFSDFMSIKKNIFKLFQSVEKELGFTISIGITEKKDLPPETIMNLLKYNTQIAKIYGKNKLYIE